MLSAGASPRSEGGLKDTPPRPAPAGTLARWKLPRFEAVLLALAAAALTYQVLLPPVVGLADNKDFDWILEPLGLERVHEEYADRYWSYVNLEYRTAERGQVRFLTSQLPLAEIALAIDHSLTRDGAFNLLFLGGVHLVTYLLGLYSLLLGTATFSGPSRQVLGILLVVAATDFAYISTFNSFYSESASLIFWALLAGSTLIALRRRKAPPWFLPVFGLLAALFLAAKPQNYPLVLPLALLLAALAPRLRSRVPVLSTVLALLLLVTGLFTLVPELKRSANLWNVVFCNILPLSASPADDLRHLGLDPELARYTGVNAWTPDPKPPFKEVAAEFGFTRIAVFYLTNPSRFLALAAQCARQAFRWRDPLYGNFTRQAGQPARALNSSFTAWSGMEDRLFPKSLWFLAVFLLAYLAGALRVAARRGLDSGAGSVAALCAAVGLMAILQFAVVVVGEGTTDVVKHLFLFQVLFDCCLISALAWLAGGLGGLMTAISRTAAR